MRRDSFLGQVLTAVARSAPTAESGASGKTEIGAAWRASPLLIAISRTTAAFSPGSNQTLNTGTGQRASRQPKLAINIPHVATNAESAEDVIQFDGRVHPVPERKSRHQALIVTCAVLAVSAILVSIVAIKKASHTSYIPIPTAPVTPLPPTGRNPIPTTPATRPTPSPTGVFTKKATASQLMQALLPSQEFGTAATVGNRGAKLANVSTLCGMPFPIRAQRTAYETLVNVQTREFLEEVIIEFQSPPGATALINSDHTALHQTGSCSWSSGGETQQFTGDYQNPVPQGCNNGLSTRVSIQPASLVGLAASAQCDSFTIAVYILSDGVGNANQAAADNYLNSAVERLRQSLARH